jgi:precorrin-2 dehydrogenase/sirohydrochlorin ferrochelatase
MGTKMAFLPLFIDFSGKRVLILGGGAVGERKARYFSAAEVVVISTDFTPGLEAMEKEGLVRLLRKAILTEDMKNIIKGAFLVVAATGDPALNKEIVDTAQKAGILANSATDTAEVIVPSLLKKESVMVAISTGGRSPAMSRYLRLKLEGSIGEDMEKMVQLQERLRKHLKKTVKDRKRREAILREVLDDAAVWEALGDEKAFETAIKHIDE